MLGYVMTRLDGGEGSGGERKWEEGEIEHGERREVRLMEIGQWFRRKRGAGLGRERKRRREQRD